MGIDGGVMRFDREKVVFLNRRGEKSTQKLPESENPNVLPFEKKSFATKV